MNNDIVPYLLEEIQNQFDEEIKANEKIKSINKQNHMAFKCFCIYCFLFYIIMWRNSSVIPRVNIIVSYSFIFLKNNNVFNMWLFLYSKIN